jgi:hypothetical protein
VGAAAGLHRYLKENGGTPQTALSEASGLGAEHPLVELVLHYYEMLAAGCDIAALAEEAENVKHAAMKEIL